MCHIAVPLSGAASYGTGAPLPAGNKRGYVPRDAMSLGHCSCHSLRIRLPVPLLTQMGYKAWLPVIPW
jgi:hypothetical protein